VVAERNRWFVGKIVQVRTTPLAARAPRARVRVGPAWHRRTLSQRLLQRGVRPDSQPCCPAADYPGAAFVHVPPQ